MNLQSDTLLVKESPSQTRNHKRHTFKFIENHRTASLATSDELGIPHIAFVYTIVKPNLSIYFSTRVEGRKYINLVENSIVSMGFGDEEKMSSVQLMGMAERVDDLKAEQDIFQELYVHRIGKENWEIPPARLFARGATNEIAIIKVTPTELTFADFATNVSGRYKPFFTKVI
jgi:general stress protein 26